MIKHRDWQIVPEEYFYGFEAVHDNYSAEHDGSGTWTGSHPVIQGKDIQDCIEQIDDWYGDTENE